MVIDVMRTLGRRWYVVVIGLLLTAGMVFGAFKASPPEYTARALVLLLPSKSDVGPGGNPFLQLSGLEQPASILAAYFSSAPAREEVKQISPTADYEIALDDSTRGPVLAVDVTDESAEETLKVLDYLLARLPTELARLQEDVDARKNAFVGSMLLTADRQPEAILSGTIRLMIAALAVGLVATGFAAVALDGFLLRRRLRSEQIETDDSEFENVAVNGHRVSADQTQRSSPSAGPPDRSEIDDGWSSDEWDESPAPRTASAAAQEADGTARDEDGESSPRADEPELDDQTSSQQSAWNW